MFLKTHEHYNLRLSSHKSRLSIFPWGGGAQYRLKLTRMGDESESEYRMDLPTAVDLILSSSLAIRAGRRVEDLAPMYEDILAIIETWTDISEQIRPSL